MLQSLPNAPIWLWVILPALLITIITFFITQRNYWVTFLALFFYLFAAFFASGYYFWVQYLAHHFIGTFDIYGLPIVSSRQGFSLILDAWPLWFLPATISAFISILICWRLKSKIPRASLTANNQKSPNHLEINQLKQLLAKQYQEQTLIINTCQQQLQAKTVELDQESALRSKIEQEVHALQQKLMQTEQQLSAQQEKTELFAHQLTHLKEI